MIESERKMSEATYFAYGTLLDINGTREICPSAEPVGVMRLPDYRLGFAACGRDSSRGGCTLEEVPGNTMYGLLYALPAKELADLDRAAGLEEGLWARLNIILIDSEGAEVPASTYIIPDPAEGYHPPESYTHPILLGAKDLSLPPTYIKQLEAVIQAAQP